MRVRFVHVDLPETRYLLRELLIRQERMAVLDFLLKRDLGARKQAYCDV